MIRGLAVIVVVCAVDLLFGQSGVLIPILVAGPLMAVQEGAVRATVVLGVVATACALVLGVADGVFGERQHVIAVLAVALGSTLIALSARTQQALGRSRLETEDLLERERAARLRADVLAEAGNLLEAGTEPERMLREVTHLAVPQLADACVVERLNADGSISDASVAATEPGLARDLQALRRRHPIDPDSRHPVAVVARNRRALLVPRMSDEDLQSYATDAEHLALMRRVNYHSAIIVPLVARGRTLGVISFGRLGQGEPYGEQDLEAGRELARRAAIALDNVRLFTELARTEGQLTAVLANLAEAVIVQNPGGSLAFANEAAATLFGASSTEELLVAPRERFLERFPHFDEAGRPLDLDGYPGRRALLGEESEHLLVRRVDPDTDDERWLLIKSTPVLADGPGAMFAVSVIEDVTEARQRELEQRFLATASKLLTSSLDVAETLDKAAWVAVPELADWCRVDLADERGTLHEAAIAHVDVAKIDVLRHWRANYPPRPSETRNPYEVLRTGESVVWDHVEPGDVDRYARDEHMAELMRIIDTRSIVMVPLTAGDRTLGTIQIATTGESGRLLGREDLALAEELGRRAGIAVENARVHAARTHIATTLQRSLLPPRLPVVPGLTIAARFRAAGETTDVGGDFYDVFPTSDGWMVVVGDVTGKGPDAAAITSLARYTMRTAAAYEPSPAGVLHRLNQTLAADGDSRRLCTAVCLRLHDRPDGGVVVSVACAGHPQPLLIGPGRPGAEPVGDNGPLLGAFEDAVWTEQEVALEAGESLVLYTDGVTDASGADGRFGHERLVELLRDAGGLSADEVAERIDETLRSFERGPQRDDVALLVLQVSPGNAGEGFTQASAPARTSG